jgi:nitrous oxide reductase accessory protein NosL
MLLVVMALPCYGAEKPHHIEDHKTCPLCGMYPARYKNFQCQIVFSDGTYEAFDSPVGLLVYLLFPDKTGIAVKKPVKIYFRDYLDHSWIDAENTYYVVGTGVMGPMGLDFLPVREQAEAQQLKAAEQGKLVIHHNHVDRQFLKKAAESNWIHFLTRKIILE